MTKDAGQAPLYEAIVAYAEKKNLAFHTPGHKQGLGAPRGLRELLTPLGLRAEVSLGGEMDELALPGGCLADACDLMAEAYGAAAAYFMINGTTGAIHTALMAALSPGDTLLLPRNAHRSLIGGAILAGANTVFIQPEINDRLGIAMGLTADSVREAIEENPGAKAIALLHPTYYGVASDLSRIVALAHEHGLTVIVDEAHGAHFAFSDRLPVTAMEAGADLAAVSLHKLTGSLTQTSVLLAGRNAPARVAAAAGILQSTSPNYLLLASLDLARRQMVLHGGELLGRAVAIAEDLRRKINKIPGLYAFGREILSTPGACDLDATKLTVSVDGLGLTGLEALRILRDEYGIMAELADAYNVLFIISYADTEREGTALYRAVESLAAHHSGRGLRPKLPTLPKIPERLLPLREAFFAEGESVPITAALGRISAEELCFYPPGIPLLCPGEVITPEVIGYATAMTAGGFKAAGVSDPSLTTLRVVKGIESGVNNKKIPPIMAAAGRGGIFEKQR